MENESLESELILETVNNNSSNNHSLGLDHISSTGTRTAHITAVNCLNNPSNILIFEIKKTGLRSVK